MSDYIIKDLDEMVLTTTENEWIEQNEEVFLVSSSEVFVALRKSIEDRDISPHKSLYKGVFKGDESVATAIIAMVETDKVALTKLLNIHFSPSAMDHLEQDEVADVYLTIIVNAFDIVDGKDHTVKIYGRGAELLSILKIVEKAGNKFWSENKKFKMEGPWLSIRPVK